MLTRPSDLTQPLNAWLHHRALGLAAGAQSAWRIVRSGGVLLALAMSASSYPRQQLTPVATQIVQATAPILVWFTLLLSLFGLVVIRIVVVTAQSYGLSEFALEMVVRVLVLELIPLTAALFVAARYCLPSGVELSAQRVRGDFEAARAQGVDPLVRFVVPRVVAGIFSVFTLVGLTSVMALLVAYGVVYGLTPWGFEAYTHRVGKVFTPAVSLVFMLKTVCFALAVALIPMASSLHDRPLTRAHELPELKALVRLFLVLLLVEMVSLIGSYY